jgi:hypothetical protein
MEHSFFLEVGPDTYATAQRVSHPQHVGKWRGVLDRVEDIAATGATTVVLPCAMLRSEGLGVQVRAGQPSACRQGPAFGVLVGSSLGAQCDACMRNAAYLRGARGQQRKTRLLDIATLLYPLRKQGCWT